MPIRIYALAKELKVENKELVDICNKAGITGKGSALASLSDDEVARLKAFVDGVSAKAAAKSSKVASKPAANSAVEAEMGAITREQYLATTKVVKSKVIEKKQASSVSKN